MKEERCRADKRHQTSPGPFRCLPFLGEKEEPHYDYEGSHFLLLSPPHQRGNSIFILLSSALMNPLFMVSLSFKIKVSKRRSSFVACLPFQYAYSSLHASSRCCALIDDRSLVLSHHFMIYGLSFGPR